MYYWVAGYTPAGVRSIAGPYQSDDAAEEATVNWMQKATYELSTPDRGQAILTINSRRNTAPVRAAKRISVRQVDEDDDDTILDDDDDFTGLDE